VKCIATCPEETKDVLIAELKALGAQDVTPIYRAVTFEAEPDVFYACHLKLRTASRLMRVIKEFPAKSPEMLYSQARRIPWPDLFDIDYGYLVEGVPGDRGREFMGSNDISKKVREGIQDAFGRRYGRIPKVDLKDPKVVVVAFIAGGKCTLSIDTSGKALHKRGYRTEGHHPAPLKETLAASILLLAGYDGTKPLMDPMCGSGTLAIEAAMIALNKSPLIHRKKGQFLLEWTKDFDKDLWRSTQDSARGERMVTLPAPIFASDVQSKYVAMARGNALRARVEKHLEFKTSRFQDLKPIEGPGLLVANLPYGERLRKGGDDQELRLLFQEIGDTLKQKFSGWRAALLAAENSPYKFIGLKPTRKIPLLNGTIPCKLLIFDLYSGSKRPKTST
jgi:putative N6-adenine-specific DNA methylase